MVRKLGVPFEGRYERQEFIQTDARVRWSYHRERRSSTKKRFVGFFPFSADGFTAFCAPTGR